MSLLNEIKKESYRTLEHWADKGCNWDEKSLAQTFATHESEIRSYFEEYENFGGWATVVERAADEDMPVGAFAAYLYITHQSAILTNWFE